MPGFQPTDSIALSWIYPKIDPCSIIASLQSSHKDIQIKYFGMFDKLRNANSLTWKSNWSRKLISELQPAQKRFRLIGVFLGVFLGASGLRFLCSLMRLKIFERFKRCSLVAS